MPEVKWKRHGAVMTPFQLREKASEILAKKHRDGYPYIIGQSESAAYAAGFEDGYKEAQKSALRWNWQTIETAPDERCIVYFSDGDIILCFPRDWKRDEGDDYWPTHWMPLPSAPDGDSAPCADEEVRR